MINAAGLKTNAREDLGQTMTICILGHLSWKRRLTLKKKKFYERYVFDKQKVWIKNSKFFKTSTQKYVGMQDIYIRTALALQFALLPMDRRSTFLTIGRKQVLNKK